MYSGNILGTKWQNCSMVHGRGFFDDDDDGDEDDDEDDDDDDDGNDTQTHNAKN